jgi:hypothetical protein
MLMEPKLHKDANKLQLVILMLMKIIVKLTIKVVNVFGMQQLAFVQLNHVQQPQNQTVLILMKNAELIWMMAHVQLHQQVKDV